MEKNLLYDYVQSNDDMESVMSGVSSTSSDLLNQSKSAAVVWFLKYYDIFVNKTVNNISGVDVEDELTEIFPTAEDADFTYTSRLKIEQKPNVELDFRVEIPQSKEGLSPLSTFDNMQKVIFEDFTNELFTNRSPSSSSSLSTEEKDPRLHTKTQLFIEISVEFVSRTQMSTIAR